METLYNPMSIVRYFEGDTPKIFWTYEGRDSFVWDQMRKRYIQITSTPLRLPSVNHGFFKNTFPNKGSENSFRRRSLSLKFLQGEGAIHQPILDLNTFVAAIFSPL